MDLSSEFMPNAIEEKCVNYHVTDGRSVPNFGMVNGKVHVHATTSTLAANTGALELASKEGQNAVVKVLSNLNKARENVVTEDLGPDMEGIRGFLVSKS